MFKFDLHWITDGILRQTKKNHARFGLQTDKFFTFRVMDHNFGSLRRVSWQRSYPKPIDQFPTINL